MARPKTWGKGLALAQPGDEEGKARTFERAKPTDVQKRIWEIIGRAKPAAMVIIGYGGAAGGGKTRGLVELAIDLASDSPGSKILVGRKDYADLRDTTLDQFDRACPPDLIVYRNDTEHVRHLRDPNWPEGVVSIVMFRELKDYLGIASQEYSAVLIDEAGEVPQNSAWMLLSRMRRDYEDAEDTRDTLGPGHAGISQREAREAGVSCGLEPLARLV